jgi:hypothetical protein
VNVNLTYKGQKHEAKAYGIKTQHVDAPEKAWTDYMRGIPYDWSACCHPCHTPEGYLKFVKWAKKKMAERGLSVDGSWKIGDVMYSSKHNRWYLCDID